jgi:hypothetical protein
LQSSYLGGIGAVRSGTLRHPKSSSAGFDREPMAVDRDRLVWFGAARPIRSNELSGVESKLA